MRRFFTEPQNIRGDTAVLQEDAAHITRVLRMSPGDMICIFDGTGTEYTARLESLDQACCTARIVSRSQAVSEPDIQVTLYQGLPKAGKMEQIIQKAVELGVHAVVPVQTARCVARLSADRRGLEKISRYQKVAVAAAKQCGRGILPQILPPVSFAEAVSAMAACDLALMPYEGLGHEGQHNLKAVLGAHPDAGTIGVLIGPEGGFSDQEVQAAQAVGLHLVGLGPRILRTETAGSTMLSVIMYEKNEL